MPDTMMVADVVGRVVFNMVGNGLALRAQSITAPDDVQTEAGKELEAFRARLLAEAGVDPDGATLLPDDLFVVIVGMDREKKICLLALQADKPVGILLKGRYATSKSIFLEELDRLPNAKLINAGNTTRAGLVAILLAEDCPKYLLIDEIDKADREMQDVLLAVLGTGHVTRLRDQDDDAKDVHVTVFAACNTTEGLREELVSRFQVLELRENTEEERRKIIEGFLVKRENVSPKFAKEVATLVAPRTTNVRDAERIARLSHGDIKLARQLADELLPGSVSRPGSKATPPARAEKKKGPVLLTKSSTPAPPQGATRVTKSGIAVVERPRARKKA
jgi:hypothetical protein